MKWEKVFFLLLLEKVEEISGHPVEGGRKGGMERLMDGWMVGWRGSMAEHNLSLLISSLGGQISSQS